MQDFSHWQYYVEFLCGSSAWIGVPILLKQQFWKPIEALVPNRKPMQKQGHRKPWRQWPPSLSSWSPLTLLTCKFQVVCLGVAEDLWSMLLIALGWMEGQLLWSGWDVSSISLARKSIQSIGLCLQACILIAKKFFQMPWQEIWPPLLSNAS